MKVKIAVSIANTPLMCPSELLGQAGTKTSWQRQLAVDRLEPKPLFTGVGNVWNARNEGMVLKNLNRENSRVIFPKIDGQSVYIESNT